MEQYAQALVAWRLVARSMGLSMRVVETTGAWKELASRCGDHGEILDFSPPSELLARGKGAVEAAALWEAVTAWAASSSGDTTVVKATGRLRVTNAERILRNAIGSDITVRGTVDRTYVDTRLVVVKTDVWIRNFKGLEYDVRDTEGFYLEHAVAARIFAAEQRGDLRSSRFRPRPIFSGMSGSTGSRYGRARDIAAQLLLSPVETLVRSLPDSKQF